MESPTKSTSKIHFFKDYAEVIKRSSSLLIMKKFEECLDTSVEAINEIKNYYERPCAKEATESLCLVAVQSYAELNRWREVLSFVANLYNGIEECPAKVLQLCLLLHSRVHDYTTCNAIAHIWLRNPNNFQQKDYRLVVEIFILHVLIAQKKYVEAPAFIDSCNGLGDYHKNYIKNYVKRVEEKEMKNKNSKTDEVTQLNCDKDETNTVEPESLEKRMLQFVQTVGKQLLQHVSYINLSLIRKLAIAAIITYLVIRKTHLGGSIWNSWLRLLKLFLQWFSRGHHKAT